MREIPFPHPPLILGSDGSFLVVVFKKVKCVVDGKIRGFQIYPNSLFFFSNCQSFWGLLGLSFNFKKKKKRKLSFACYWVANQLLFYLSIVNLNEQMQPATLLCKNSQYNM